MPSTLDVLDATSEALDAYATLHEAAGYLLRRLAQARRDNDRPMVAECLGELSQLALQQNVASVVPPEVFS